MRSQKSEVRSQSSVICFLSSMDYGLWTVDCGLKENDMPKERVKRDFMNIEIYETWKSYERIAQSFELNNPLTYEDLRNSFRCYYQGGVYIPEGLRKARMESFFLRFFPEGLVKDYSKSIAAPVFGFEWQLRIRLVDVGVGSLSRRVNKIDLEFFNYVWNKTFSKEEQEEIVKIRKLAQKSLALLSRLSSYFKEYHEFLEKVRDWEMGMVRKGKVYQ